MHFQTFHNGSDEMDPLSLLAQRESEHCEQLGVPFLHIEDEQGDSTWAYLWPADKIPAVRKAELGDYTAQYYVLLVDQSRFMGTIGTKLIPYHGYFKEWHAKLRQAALRWSYFPAEEIALV